MSGKFSAQIKAFADKTRIKTDTVLRKVTFDLMTEIVRRTPVDTGMARNNYFVSYDRSASVETGTSKTGAASIERAAQFTATLKAGGVCYITNNLPYIMKILEYGTSDQMAAGGLSRIVARWQAIVDGAAAGSRQARVQEFKGVSE